MFCLNDGYCTLSLEEVSLHRDCQSELDPYDYFRTNITVTSKLVEFKVIDVDIYIFNLNELIDGLNSLIKGTSDTFIFSLRKENMTLNFQRSFDRLSYTLSFTLKSLDDGDFSLSGLMGLSTDSMIELVNDIKYFMSAYE